MCKVLTAGSFACPPPFPSLPANNLNAASVKHWRATVMDASTSRQTAGLSRRGSTHQSPDQEVTSRPEGGEKDPNLSTKWTDEKHSLYLNSMEASFVSQLYDSPDFPDWPPRKRNLSKSKPSSSKHYNACISSSDQFKVLRGGMWQKMKFVRAESHQQYEDLQSDPWIKHFRSSRRDDEDARSAIPMENDASTTSEAMKQKMGKQELGEGDTTSSRQFQLRNPLYYEDYSVGCINIEVSDQNFMEDDNIGGSAERMKTVGSSIV